MKYVVFSPFQHIYNINLYNTPSKGLLNFRRDIYERDNGLKEMIFDKKIEKIEGCPLLISPTFMRKVILH